MSTNEQTFKYKEAGVDIHLGESIVDQIKPHVQSTHNASVVKNYGGFGGMFNLWNQDDGGQSSLYGTLVASTDGVGTKGYYLKRTESHLKNTTSAHYTSGLDIVHHCINDILVEGARPLFFLDYYASSKLNAKDVVDFVRGCSEACRNYNCALLGGETAEMPKIYAKIEPIEPNGKQHEGFDIVGTIVGMKYFDMSCGIDTGDVVLALPSSGPHTNGYSLISHLGINYSEEYPELRAPHKCYFNEINSLVSLDPEMIHALCHITGGGVRNIKRIMPDNYHIVPSSERREPPKWCQYIQNIGKISDAEMEEVFNMGIGMLVFMNPLMYEEYQEKITFDHYVYGYVENKPEHNKN